MCKRDDEINSIKHPLRTTMKMVNQKQFNAIPAHTYTCNVCRLFCSHLHIKSIQFWLFEFNKRDGMRDSLLGGNGKTHGKLADFFLCFPSESHRSQHNIVTSYMTVKFYCYGIFFCFFASLGFRIPFNGSK